MARVNYPELKLIRYHCKAKTGLVKNRCNEKTGLSTKIVRFFQDDTLQNDCEENKCHIHIGEQWSNFSQLWRIPGRVNGHEISGNNIINAVHFAGIQAVKKMVLNNYLHYSAR